MTAPGERLVSGPAEKLVTSLLQALRVSQIHAFENRAMEQPLADLVATLDELITAEATATVLGTEGQIYVNGRRLAVTGAALDRARELATLFGRKGIGGLRFERRIDREGARALLEAVNRTPPGSADGTSFIRAHLARSGKEGLGFSAFRPRSSRHGPTAAIDVATRARLLYAKLLVLLEEILGPRGKEAAAERFLATRLKRALQEVIATSERAPQVYLALATADRSEGRAVHHPANAAVLSILIGRTLGLERSEICDLAVAAALHDLGKRVADTVRRAVSLDRSTQARLVAGYETAAAGISAPHLFSRIVATACAFDEGRDPGTRGDAEVLRALDAVLASANEPTEVISIPSPSPALPSPASSSASPR